MELTHNRFVSNFIYDGRVIEATVKLGVEIILG